MKKLLTLLALCLCTAAQAQLSEQDTARWSSSLGGSLFYSRGNVQRLLCRADGSLKHLGQRWGASTDAYYLYGTFGPFQTENDLLSRNFLYYNPRKRLYPYLMAWGETLYRRRLDLRYELGTGLTWVALQKPKHLLKVSATLAYEYNRYATDRLMHMDNPETEFALWRGIVRLYGRHTLPHKLSLHYEGWLQPHLAGTDNLRAYALAGLQLPITPRVSFRADANYVWETVTPIGTKQEDLYLTVGLKWNLK